MAVGSGPGNTENEPEHPQVRVFRILLENGARPDVTGRIGDSVWSLRDVALFNKIEKRCLQQVEDALTSITVQPVVLSETMDPKKGHNGAFKGYVICNACYYVSDFGLELVNLIPSTKASLFVTHSMNTDNLLLGRKCAGSSTSVPSALCTSVTNAIGIEISSTSRFVRVPSGSKKNPSLKRKRFQWNRKARGRLTRVGTRTKIPGPRYLASQNQMRNHSSWWRL